MSFNTTTSAQQADATAVAVSGGTCCSGSGTCYPPNHDPVRGWWRSDGKPCGAAFDVADAAAAEPVKV
ncbi:hypothetical protein [Kordia sp. SMS9]|uniref:hypothetical protein n=1 Tax=Kordia sp. SMS9 TaxID=2282170 RepID=UPI0013B3A20C|nr:hypothetical protein [Kordia sp. SMS9]